MSRARRSTAGLAAGLLFGSCAAVWAQEPPLLDIAPPAGNAPPTRSMLVGAGAVLHGLDKITARVSEFAAPVDQPVTFGTLHITVRACRKTPPEEPPESAAYLEVVEERQGLPPTLVFSGWMFASSPALSALEHPVYDVWVIDCRIASAEGSRPRQ